jgi:biotin carboxylase
MALVKVLRNEIPNLQVINLPHVANPAHLVQIVDSKNGFRTAMADLFPREGVRLPIGYTCDNGEEVLSAIAELLKRDRGFVIKIHNGESGWGVKMVNHQESMMLDQSRMNVWLEDLFRSDHIWEFAPYIVEEFITVDTKIAGGFPSGEGYVNDTGFRFTYSCGQEVSQLGEFEGILIDTGSLPTFYNEVIEKTLNTIGTRLYSMGYRGIFDVDFAAGTDGNLYILECNARVTGGTHVYDAISHLKISAEEGLYIYSNDSLRYGDVTRPPKDVLSVCSNLLYPIQDEKRGVLITFVSPSQPVIGIIVIGRDREDALLLGEHVRSGLKATQVIN